MSKGLIIKLFLSIVAVCLLVILIAFYQIKQQLNQPLNLGQPQLLTVVEGQYAHSILNKLKNDGLLRENIGLKLLLKVKPTLAKVRLGTYQITPGMTGVDVLELLSSGTEKQFSISLVEGLRWRDWVLQITQHPTLLVLPTFDAYIEKLQSKAQGNSLEGWLMPETYFFTKGTNATEVIQRAHDDMLNYIAQAWDIRAFDLPYETPYEALIMASIIEKETAVASERSRIAAVFVNRLRINMRLQTDPTVIYGMGESFDGDIRRKDLKASTPYNTYVIKGLPPTPIAMPSKLAIDAALHPDTTEELYFVAIGDGSHKFSLTLQEHNLAVRQYQLKK
jgi:UPF0755 protein